MDITEIEETTGLYQRHYWNKNKLQEAWRASKLAMTLHHHRHSSLQKKLWCSSADLLKFSLKHASAVPATVSIPIGGATTTIIILHPLGCFIGVSGGSGWGRDPSSRRRCDVGFGGFLLTHLLFFLIGVAEDDDLAVIRQPEYATVEVSRMGPSLSEDEERSTTGAFPEGPPCSTIREQWQCEEISGEDYSGGREPDGADGGVEALLNGEEPSLEGERERLVPLLSSIFSKWREREGTLSENQRSVRWLSAQDEWGINSLWSVVVLW
jgi:hypothetical protein